MLISSARADRKRRCGRRPGRRERRPHQQLQLEHGQRRREQHRRQVCFAGLNGGTILLSTSLPGWAGPHPHQRESSRGGANFGMIPAALASVSGSGNHDIIGGFYRREQHRRLLVGGHSGSTNSSRGRRLRGERFLTQSFSGRVNPGLELPRRHAITSPTATGRAVTARSIRSSR